MNSFKKYIQTLIVVPLTISTFAGAENTPNLINPQPKIYVLAQREMSLDNRYDVQFVNDVFKDNILLNLAYLRGTVTKAADIDWRTVTKPFQYEFTLSPNKTFAYHEDVKDQYKGKVEKTTNAHFNGAEGFKTDGYLFGDGVCHLASLLNWVAREAELEVESPTNHDFAKINDISKEYGVSIYSSPFSKGSNTLQNLYITNNKNKPITFKFAYKDNKVSVTIVKED
ncbi:VanW family protein [Candidatus Daviesbacteria bacterium]|nr:VanW family protein [Candidatus Daviesbacteria bacterium]